MSNDQQTRVSANGTWINLGLLIMVVGGAISLTSFLVGYSKDLQSAVVLLTSINGRMESVERAVTGLEYATSDYWSGTDMKLWAAELQRLNATLSVPPATRARTDER